MRLRFLSLCLSPFLPSIHVLHPCHILLYIVFFYFHLLQSCSLDWKSLFTVYPFVSSCMCFLHLPRFFHWSVCLYAISFTLLLTDKHTIYVRGKPVVVPEFRPVFIRIWHMLKRLIFFLSLFYTQWISLCDSHLFMLCCVCLIRKREKYVLMTFAYLFRGYACKISNVNLLLLSRSLSLFLSPPFSL